MSFFQTNRLRVKCLVKGVRLFLGETAGQSADEYVILLLVVSLFLVLAVKYGLTWLLGYFK